MSIRRVIVLWVGAAAACGRSTGAPPAPTPEVARLDALERVVRSARGTGLSPEEHASLSRAGEPEALDFLRTVARSDTAADLAPKVLFPREATLVTILGRDSTLHRTMDRGKAILARSENECGLADAVEVTPWWDVSTKVLVCPQSYKPEVLTEVLDVPGVGREEFGCPNSVASTGACGCGPYLMWCAPEELADEVLPSYRAELNATITTLIKRGARLPELFLTDGSFRSRLAERWYARARVLRGDSPDLVFAELARWPVDGKWAPRDLPREQLAGILTTPQLLWEEDVPRTRLLMLQKALWCVESRSVNVDAHRILALGRKDFRWSSAEEYELAHTPVCDSCHARLDYGIPFFRAYRDETFRAPSETKPGKVYFSDIKDLRAEVPGDATPLAYATQAVVQKEFGQCLTSKVVEQVFGDEALSADYRAVLAAYEADQSYRSMLTIALERRFAQLTSPPGATTAPLALDALLEQKCRACHDEDSDLVLSSATLDPALAIKAAKAVSEGRMPRSYPPLGWPEREAVIDGLLSKVPSPIERAALVVNLTRRTHNINIPRTLTIAQGIRARAGATGGPAPEAVMPYDALSLSLSELSPEVALSLAIGALEACKQTHTRRADLEKCVTAAALELPRQ